MIEPSLTEPPDLVPQAVLAVPIEDALKDWGAPTEGLDDLDYYRGRSFLLDGRVGFSVRHYRGHPPGTSTIYLDGQINTVNDITMVLHQILSGMGIPGKSLAWQRIDNPDL